LGCTLNQSSSINNNNSSILAVDDGYDIVNLIKQSLEMDGRKVCAFTDAFAALEHFNSDGRNDYHSIVVSDIRMPGMNGYDLIRKAKEIDKQVKVVLMSAFEIQEKEFHNLLPDIRVDAFLQKPFSTQELKYAIDRVGRGSQ
jgi:DNA-binding NtrC family response regulator